MPENRRLNCRTASVNTTSATQRHGTPGLEAPGPQVLPEESLMSRPGQVATAMANIPELAAIVNRSAENSSGGKWSRPTLITTK